MKEHYYEHQIKEKMLQKDLNMILGDESLHEFTELKMASALDSGDIVFQFYDLQKKKFFKEIDPRRPFIIGAKVRIGSSGVFYNLFAYNKAISSYFNKERLLKSDRFFSDEGYRKAYKGYGLDHTDLMKLVEKEKKDLVEYFAESEESKALLKQFIDIQMRLCSHYEMSPQIPYDKQNHSVASEFIALEKKLIELEVNSKVLYYMDLIHFCKKQTITHEKVKAFLNERRNIKSSGFNRPNKITNETALNSYLLKNAYYLPLFPESKRNTTKKMLKLLKINGKISCNLIDKQITQDIDFIVACLNEGHDKTTLSNPNLQKKEVIRQVMELSLQGKVKFTNLPNETLKIIRQDKELSQVIYEMFMKTLSLDNTYKNNNNAIANLALFIEYIVNNFHGSCFTKELLEMLISLSGTDIGNTLFYPSIFARFKAKDKKQYEDLAISKNPNNFYGSSRSRNATPEDLYELAKVNFSVIRFQSFFKSKPDYSIIARCLEIALEHQGKSDDWFSESFHDEKILATYGRTQDKYIRELIKEAELHHGYIINNGWTSEDIKKLLITCRSKNLQSKLQVKSTKSKINKI